MRRAPLLVLPLFVLLLTGCGGGSSPSPSPDEGTDSRVEAPTATPTEIDTAVTEILGDAGSFVAGGSGASGLTVALEGRECVLGEALPVSCRASTGAAGGFVVTAEGVAEAPGSWNIVVRCGIDPALPAASASGDFQPVTADLGLAPYGEVVGILLAWDDRVEGALAYFPEGAQCPVVWGLGEIDRNSFFTGGTDALNGEESPLLFLDGTGAQACAVADGDGGIRVGSPQGRDCA